MSDQQQRPADERPPVKRGAQKPVDLDALTAAVERLLRRDLAIERERVRAKKRTVR